MGYILREQGDILLREQGDILMTETGVIIYTLTTQVGSFIVTFIDANLNKNFYNTINTQTQSYIITNNNTSLKKNKKIVTIPAVFTFTFNNIPKKNRTRWGYIEITELENEINRETDENILRETGEFILLEDGNPFWVDNIKNISTWSELQKNSANWLEPVFKNMTTWSNIDITKLNNELTRENDFSILREQGDLILLENSKPFWIEDFLHTSSWSQLTKNNTNWSSPVSN